MLQICNAQCAAQNVGCQLLLMAEYGYSYTAIIDCFSLLETTSCI